MYTNLRYIVLLCFIFCFEVQLSFAQFDQEKNKDDSKKSAIESLKPLKKIDLPAPLQDTVKIDSTKITKEYLESNIRHTAEDTISNDFINQKVVLYNKAELYYKDIELKAGKIIIDYKKSLAYAVGIIDSLGNYTQKPEFTQGSQVSVQDSLIYNFKNEKAIIYNSRTEQQGVIITGDITKKENDSTFYINKAKFTTSQKEKPDYYIQTSNIKVVPNSKIVGGISNLVIADVPTPLFLPFFYAPITKGRASGFLIPTWGENRSQGYFLQNGGYYFAINDYVDLAVLADIYTNGSWGIRTESSYAVRYRFSGNFSFRYENLVFSERGFPDYSKSTSFFVRWTHNQSTQSNPNSRFAASVNFGSSNFFQNSLNESSSPFYIVNTFNSSINYFQNFDGSPFSLNASLTHTQNTRTEKIDMNLPSLNINMDRIYPFAPKFGAKRNPIQNLGVTYTMSAQNRISTTDDEFFTEEMFKKAQTGIQHDVAVGTNIKFLKFITISPNANYRDVWYFKTIDKYWDDIDEEVVTDTINGFATYREWGANVSASTTVYGMVEFKKGKLKAIRHIMRPAISYSYRPNFNQYYDEYQASIDPDDIREYTKFQNGMFGAPSRNLSNSIGLSVNNTLEAKVASNDEDEDTEENYKKIQLLNNLNFSTNYNMAADSLKWSPVRMTAGTVLLKNKLNINLNASMDPYAINANGTRINTFNINNGGSLFRLTNANLTANYAISSKEFGKNKKQSSSANKRNVESATGDNLFGGSITNNRPELNTGKEDEVKVTKLYKTQMPWDIRLRYSLNYANTRGENTISANSVQISGNIEFSPKWRVGVSSGYDFENKGITYTQLRFERDLDSWRFSFNWVPFGDRATYYFFIGVKSSALSDLKYDQRRIPDRRLF